MCVRNVASKIIPVCWVCCVQELTLISRHKTCRQDITRKTKNLLFVVFVFTFETLTNATFSGLINGRRVAPFR